MPFPKGSSQPRDWTQVSRIAGRFFTIWDTRKALRRSSVQFSRSVASDSLQPHELQHSRPPCPSPTAAVYPHSCPLSLWCHLTISFSVVPFSSCLQSFPTSGSFQMSQFFASGGQIIGASASASVLPMNIQDWFPLGWTGWISLGLSRVFPIPQLKSINSLVYLFLEVQLIYKVVLVSGTEKSNWVIHTYSLLQIISPYRLLQNLSRFYSDNSE